MLNITTSLASLGQILRANNSKPAVTLPSTPASTRNPASAASISDQGQAMLAQEAAKGATSSAMQGELPVEMYQIPPWLASVLPMTGGELPKLLNGFGDSHLTLNKSFLYDGKDQERADYTKFLTCTGKMFYKSTILIPPKIFIKKLLWIRNLVKISISS